jgi:hypothetical protein
MRRVVQTKGVVVQEGEGGIEYRMFMQVDRRSGS